MVTKDQQQWFDHLSNTDKVIIVPWDPLAEVKFLQIKNQIQDLLGTQQAVEHRGASSFKISGQDEIDIYIPVPKDKFDQTVNSITSLYGNPKSSYSLKRARFVTSIENKHIDVFVINREDKGWLDSEIFNNYLLSNPVILDRYRILKERLSGESVRNYYKEKIEFINEILDRVKLGR